MIRRTAPALLIALAALLTGCAPVAGEVIQKEYEPSETERYSCSKTTTVNGKTSSKPSTCTRYDGEDWVLFVRDADGHVHEVDVSRTEFESLKVGDVYGEQQP